MATIHHKRKLVAAASPLESDPSSQASFDSGDRVPQPSHRRRRLVAGIVGVVGLAVGGGVFAMTQSGDNKSTPTPVEASGDEKPRTTPTTEAATTTLAIAEQPAHRLKTGNIYLAHLLPGEPFITATTSRGEVIKVPQLRVKGTPSQLAESALSLMSCYLSTGEQACLDKLTQNQNIQNGLKEWRQREFVKENTFTQAVFYDKEAFPTEFTRTTEGSLSVVKLSGGDLLYEAHQGDLDWQSDAALESNTSIQWLVSDLELAFEPTFNDGLELVRYSFHTK